MAGTNDQRRARYEHGIDTIAINVKRTNNGKS